MRLIDADALIEKLQRNSAFGMVRNAADKNVYEIIAEQPTAYDVEKVVESLKNHPNVFQEFKGCYIPLENAVEVVESNDGKGWWNE